MATPDVALGPTSASLPGAGPADVNKQRIFVASQWQLMWWRFRKHKVAVASALVVIGFYLVVVGADFLAYADPNASEAQRSLMPPQRVHWFDGWRFGPYVYAVKGARDLQSFKRVYRTDPGEKIPVRFFAKGFEYRFLGLIPTTRHLIGVDGGRDAAKTIFLLGTDVQGRDLWSRLMYGTRISLTIGLVGVTMSLLLGVVLGGLSGFYGGIADTLIQRIIEILRSIPTIPLWMGLAAALPRDWSDPASVFRHHHHHLPARLDRAGPRRPGTLPLPAGGGLRRVGAAGGLQPDADHLRAHGAVVHEPHHRRHHPRSARHDRQRDGPQLSRPGPAPARHELGSLAPAGPERPDGGHLAVADASRRCP